MQKWKRLVNPQSTIVELGLNFDTGAEFGKYGNSQ
jgi:hypothetical protein